MILAHIPRIHSGDIMQMKNLHLVPRQRKEKLSIVREIALYVLKTNVSLT